MRKKDLWSGIAVIVISLYFFSASLAMPWTDTGFSWYGAPGLTPAVLAVFLGLTGFILVYRSLRGHRFYQRLEKETPQSPLDESTEESGSKLPRFLKAEKNRVTLVIVLCFVYAFILLGNLPYILATALFVGSFIAVFRGAGWLKTLLIAILTSVCVWFVFDKIFAVFLP